MTLLSFSVEDPFLAARVLAVPHFAGETRVEVVPERRVPPQLETGRVPRLVPLEAWELPSQHALDAELREPGFLQLGRPSENFVS
jgi:hypothetical protein